MSEPRRSSRSRNTVPALPGYVHEGLKKLIKGNENEVRAMLDAPKTEASGELIDRLATIMQQQQLNPEVMLGRFFSSQMLSDYCLAVGKSGAGGAGALATRAVAYWQKEFADAKSPAAKSAPKKSPAKEPERAKAKTPPKGKTPPKAAAKSKRGRGKEEEEEEKVV
mmetsp:Transcript_55861/g.114168  ORF Transcript_55861/g.114168 Transcript_55861/m.114168 type:complete len:166 (-) Transcript_55861:14-511(-)